MGSPPASPTSLSPRPPRRRGWLLLPVAAVGAAASFGLVCTNPAPVEFEAFAADRLADLAVHELCHDDGLPMLLRLVVQNCAELIGSQRAVFGQLVLRQSERFNFGLFSLYRTNLGGQRLWAGWHLPHYGVLTLAVAGQFVVLRTTERAP